MIFDSSFLLASAEHAFLVHLINLLLVEFFGLVTLDLHCVGDDSTAKEWLSLDIDILWLLK